MAISLASLMAMTSLDEAEKMAISIALIYVRGAIALRYKHLMTMAFDKATGCHCRASNSLVIQRRPPWSSWTGRGAVVLLLVVVGWAGNIVVI